MKNAFEATYGNFLKGIFYVVNPLKKKIIKTYCIAHKFICFQGMSILKNEGYMEEYIFFLKHIKRINDGVTWADQDFKSSNHFYHYQRETGLYGFSNALIECTKYYNLAAGYIDAGDINKGMFYFGAACHLIQDATVPQHVNNRLLKEHRHFEQWIIRKLSKNTGTFEVNSGIIKYDKLDDFIKKNASEANNIYSKYAHIVDTDEKYKKIASESISMAQKSTAGIMLKFYKDVIYKE